MKTENNSFLSNSILTLTRQLIGIVIGVLVVSIVARGLGSTRNGEYTLITYVPIMLMTFLNLGINSSTVYYVGRKKISINSAYTTNIIISIALSIISILIGAAAIYILKDSYFKQTNTGLLYLSLLSLPGIFLMTFMQTILQGMEHFRSYNTALVVQQFSNLFFLVVFLFVIPLGVLGTILAFILGYVCSVVYMTFFLIKYSEASFSFHYFSFSELKELLTYGIKAHVSNIMTFFNYRLDVFLVANFLSMHYVGVYTFAVNIGERLSIFSQSISQVLLPRIAATNAEEDRNQITSMVSRFLMILVLLMSVALFIVSGLIVRLLGGADYPESPMLLRWIIPGVAVLAVEKILSNDLAGRGKPELNMYVSFFNVALNVVLNLILIPKIGVAGAAISTTITYVASFIIKCWIYKKETKMRYRTFLVMTSSDFALIKKIFQGIRGKLAVNK
ncbi:MAG: flippase [Bacillota bacterium]|nr:flippase [Bacillota bacterium]